MVTIVIAIVIKQEPLMSLFLKRFPQSASWLEECPLEELKSMAIPASFCLATAPGSWGKPADFPANPHQTRSLLIPDAVCYNLKYINTGRSSPDGAGCSELH